MRANWQLRILTCMDVNELGGPLKMADFLFSTARDYNSDIVPLTEQNRMNFVVV